MNVGVIVAKIVGLLVGVMVGVGHSVTRSGQILTAMSSTATNRSGPISTLC